MCCRSVEHRIDCRRRAARLLARARRLGGDDGRLPDLGTALGARFSGFARRFVARRPRARRSAGEAIGDWTIIICRPVPVLAEASVIFAGLVGAPFSRFLVLTALSNLGIAIGYAAFGAFSMSMDSFLVAFLGALTYRGSSWG